MLTTTGALNRRISIQTQSTSQDLSGPPLNTWATVYSAWASIDIQQSELIYSTAEFISKVTHRITCRWTSSFVFNPKQRIVFTQATTGVAHTYEIQAVVNDKQANVFVTLLCYELDAVE